MKVLIIEDEQLAAKRLGKLITELRPKSEIVKSLDSIEDAVIFLEQEEKIDLIFMDIQLADGISFEIFNKTKVNFPVIFTTAYDHYAVKAFKVNSVDYLLKPIEIADLEDAISKFESRFQSSNSKEDITDLIQTIRKSSDTYKKRFLVKTAGRLTFVLVKDVAFFFSEEGNTFLVTSDNERFLLESTLEEIETQIDPISFFRISRKMLISLESIQKIEPHYNNRFIIQLLPRFEEDVIVSRQRSAEFRKWLDS